MTKKKPAQKKRKKDSELTDAEVLKKLFPKKVRAEIERVAKESDDRAEAKEKRAREKAEKAEKKDS